MILCCPFMLLFMVTNNCFQDRATEDYTRVKELFSNSRITESTVQSYKSTNVNFFHSLNLSGYFTNVSGLFLPG